MTTVLDRPKAAPETLPNTLLEDAEVPRKRWTRAEYRKLEESGFLGDGKYELVLGEIWKKMRQGRLHIIAVMRVLQALATVFGFDRIQSQSSLPVGDAEPEPDVAVLVLPIDQYKETEPTEADTTLVVEVSNSTLAFDLSNKVMQYGSVGIPEYWVVDIPNQLLHVFRQPHATGYTEEIVLMTDDEVRPLAAPDSSVRVAELLP